MTDRERAELRDKVVRARLARDPHLQTKRQCKACCQWKPETEEWFTLRLRPNRPNDWLDTTCRKCRSKQRMKWRAENRERDRANERARVRDWAVEYHLRLNRTDRTEAR